MIVYHSRSGNVRNIVDRVVGFDNSISYREISTVDKIEEPFFIFTYTDGLGQVPEETLNFLKNNENHRYVKGVIVSGNINFGQFYGGAADKISNWLKVPVIRKIDLRGNSKDIEEIAKKYNEFFKKEI